MRNILVTHKERIEFSTTAKDLREQRNRTITLTAKGQIANLTTACATPKERLLMARLRTERLTYQTLTLAEKQILKRLIKMNLVNSV